MKKMKIMLLCAATVWIAAWQTVQPPLKVTKDKRVEYTPYANGDRVIDFSVCGYRASQEPIADVGVRVRVPWREGDATARIQQAIDYVAGLPVDAAGFRGAVSLEKGSFRIDGSLVIRTSGVVLRGSGIGETELVGTGCDRETLIRIMGGPDRRTNHPISIKDNYVPVGAVVLTLGAGHGLKPGERVLVRRPSIAGWIAALGCDKIGQYVNHNLTAWRTGDFDMCWDRVVQSVTTETVTLDASLTLALDARYGAGMVCRYAWPDRVRDVGIENFTCRSEYDPANPKDENHRWMAITVENAEDVWVRRITARHFVSSAVAVWAGARRVTVEDCKSLSPVGEIGGYRRLAFQTSGQQTLFLRCYAERGWQDFTVGFSTPGPNAFVECWSSLPTGFSGAVGGMANGVLWDRVTVDGGDLSVAWRDADGQGGGWSGANCMFWRCRAARLYLPTPPQAHNWAWGMHGQVYGDGEVFEPRAALPVESLFYAQLEARTGQRSSQLDKMYTYPRIDIGALKPGDTPSLSARSQQPDFVLDAWIDSMVRRYPLPVAAQGVVSVDDLAEKAENHRNSKGSDRRGGRVSTVQDDPKVPAGTAVDFAVRNGVVIRGDGRAVAGTIIRTPLWRGSTRPSAIREAIPHLTRFVPGREGRGLTDNLDTLAADMLRDGCFAINHFPGLWYERRRDDHARVRRADADVWAPFYEQPFARSGVGEACDRLSKYDVTQYNKWYWMRLGRFADLADRDGLLLIHDHYLQHNLIEEGAHWTDYPWRSANNINDLGFPEPTWYAGDRRVFMADQFYDVQHAVRRETHRNYIRKSLSQFAPNRNVIHHLGVEYTGPAEFARFWLDVIDQWERETNLDARVMLSATKDVEDALLSDPHYRSLIDIVEVRQWAYRQNGRLYDPPGGVSMAERQYARVFEAGETGFDGVWRSVAHYRMQYPEKAVTFTFATKFPHADWAAFVAGGSFTTIPVRDAAFLRAAARMSPSEHLVIPGKQWGMGAQGVGYIVYSAAGSVAIDLFSDPTAYVLRWIDPEMGAIVGRPEKLKPGAKAILTAPAKEAVAWLSVR